MMAAGLPYKHTDYYCMPVFLHDFYGTETQWGAARGWEKDEQGVMFSSGWGGSITTKN